MWVLPRAEHNRRIIKYVIVSERATPPIFIYFKKCKIPRSIITGSGPLKSETAFLDGKLIPLLLPEFPKKSARETKHDKAITTKFKSV